MGVQNGADYHFVSLNFKEGEKMSGMTCDVTGCRWNDGCGGCDCDGIYISDAETGEPTCMSVEYSED